MKLVPKAIFADLVAIEAGGAVAVSDGRERILAHISRDAWAVLRQVDGVRTLEVIAETTGLADREDAVWRYLDELAEAGLIARLAPPAGTGPLHRRQMLSGALYTGAVLGLAAAAPVFAATTAEEQAQKKKKPAVHSQEQAAKAQTPAQMKAAGEANTKQEQKDMTAREQLEKASDSANKSIQTNRAAEQKQKTPSPQAQEAQQK